MLKAPSIPKVKYEQHTDELLPQFAETCFVISNFLSRGECNALIALKKQEGFASANTHYPTYYRNNERKVSDNEHLANQLFEKARYFLPEKLEIKNRTGSESGIWNLKKINERIRFCRYKSGQFFSRHLDGVHFRSRTLQSKLTFMVYLNGPSEFEGGKTLFYASRTSTEPVLEYTPQQGDLLVFDHNLWHEGARVEQGEKYILRSDILYEKEACLEGDSLQQNYQNGHLGYIWALMKQDESSLVSAGRDKCIRIWDAAGRKVQELRGHRQSILDLEKMDHSAFVSCSRDSSLKIWKRTGEEPFALVRTIEFPGITLLNLQKISPSIFACSGSDGAIRICSLNGTMFRKLTGHKDWVWTLAVSGSYLLSVSQDKTLKVWNWHTSGLVHDCRHSNAALTSLLVIGDSIYAGDQEGKVHQWHWNGVELPGYQGYFQAHTGLIRTMTHIEEQFLVTGAEDNYIRVWTSETKELVKEYQHQNFVQSVIYDATKQTLISSSYDGAIAAWETPEIATQAKQ